MTTPMIDRLKERIAELEQTNAVLQTLLACMVASADADGIPGDPRCVFIEAEAVRFFSGRTITSEPEVYPEGGEVLGVHVTIDPVDLPDFGGNMQGLLAREDRH